MLYPVAQYQHTTIARQHQVEHDMTVPEDKEVDVRRRILATILPGITHQELVVFALIGKVIAMLAAVSRPSVGKGNPSNAGEWTNKGAGKTDCKK